MSIWERYPNYSDDELRALVQVTAEALIDEGESEVPLPDDLLTISPRAAARQILPELHDAAPQASQVDVQHVLEDEILARQVCLRILEEVRRYPELAEEVDRRYAARQQKMAVPELILVSAALVILAMRIKEIKFERKNKRITFYPSGVEVKAFVSGLVNSIASR